MNDLLFQLAKRGLEIHEGRKHKVYFCPTGKLTIGVGRNLEDKGVSDAEIDAMLRNDIKQCIETLSNRLVFWDRLTRNRQYVLVDMLFNMGPSLFRKWPKFFAALQADDWRTASREMLRNSAGDGPSEYLTEVGDRAERLSEIMRTNQLPLILVLKTKG